MILSLVRGGYLRGVENLGDQGDLVARLHVKFTVEGNGRTAHVLWDS